MLFKNLRNIGKQKLLKLTIDSYKKYKSLTKDAPSKEILNNIIISLRQDNDREFFKWRTELDKRESELRELVASKK